MFIEKYFYKTATEKIGKSLIIPELSRNKYMTKEYIRLFKDQLTDVNIVGSCAFLYAAGPASHHNDIRDIKGIDGPKGSAVIKGQVGFTVYTVANMYDNIEHVSINANTCASSMYCLHEARWLLEQYDNVIVYAEDMVDDTEMLLFKQLGIDLVCSDGIAMMHLTRSRTDNSIAEIPHTAWGWNKDTSPMGVSKEGYNKVLDKFNLSDINLVKPHGTGTFRNDQEEDLVISQRFPNAKIVKYKPEIGHTQGASALIELCMLLDREDNFTAICIASGLGAHYGAIKVIK